MNITALVDNDILFKASCYRILVELLAPYCSADSAGVLMASRFVVGNRLEKKGRADALKLFFHFLNSAQLLEPTESELSMAADFELAAQKASVQLDTGESQLCAILVQRSIPVLLTGDKRAINALENLLDAVQSLSSIQNRIHCLEFLMLKAVSESTIPNLTSAVRANKGVDKTMDICFGGSSPDEKDTSIIDGLTSYLNSLKAQAPRVLAA